MVRDLHDHADRRERLQDPRVRDPKATLSGGIDPSVLLELALYGIVGLYLVLTHARPPRIGRTQPHLFLACAFVGLMVLSVGYTAYPQYTLVRARRCACSSG